MSIISSLLTPENMDTTGTPPKHQRKSKSSLRGLSRLCAVQAVYRADFCQRKISSFLDDNDSFGEVFLTETISSKEMDREFFRDLLIKMEENLDFVDAVIEEHLSANWRMDRLDPVIKYILRLAITELYCFMEIPAKVVLNEYIEIAKAFSRDSETAFVNGLLNKALKAIRTS
ncbi:MAG: transcription antitermination factor NusB [Holosporaceae bacterium]|nr:transcription antitermination factor NusB [Holosporaceae bacterium]